MKKITIDNEDFVQLDGKIISKEKLEAMRASNIEQIAKIDEMLAILK